MTIEKSLVHSSENFDAQLVCHVLAEPQATVRRAGIKEDSNSIEQDDMAWNGMGLDYGGTVLWIRLMWFVHHYTTRMACTQQGMWL